LGYVRNTDVSADEDEDEDESEPEPEPESEPEPEPESEPELWSWSQWPLPWWSGVWPLSDDEPPLSGTVVVLPESSGVVVVGESWAAAQEAPPSINVPATAAAAARCFGVQSIVPPLGWWVARGVSIRRPDEAQSSRRAATEVADPALRPLSAGVQPTLS